MVDVKSGCFVSFWSSKIFDTIVFFLLLGVIAKSAQIGLHTWLPAAMEGPTPVSALIHAATMVTAGIFLVIRVSFIFEISDVISAIAICMGVATAFFSALSACFLYDMKRIIAYSTCSQLGYMLLAAGLSQYHISLFHLINHAFFKALLFLTAGAIIHSFSNEQDIRKVGALFQRSPFIFSSLLIGNFAIMGLPFLSGFYSKDLILEATLSRLSIVFTQNSFYILFIAISCATCITAIYSCRIIFYLVFRPRQVRYVEGQTTYLQQPFFIKLVLSIIMLFSIFSGYLLSDIFTDNFFMSLPISILQIWHNSFNFELEYLLPFQKLIPIFLNVLVISVFLCIIY
jgi:NADH:ubiquinone oxidoreductase subunit 5 (subunit L)/multisubunit Na+/H+ antiporter MnhA subunit